MIKQILQKREFEIIISEIFNDDIDNFCVRLNEINDNVYTFTSHTKFNNLLIRNCGSTSSSINFVQN